MHPSFPAVASLTRKPWFAVLLAIAIGLGLLALLLAGLRPTPAAAAGPAEPAASYPCSEAGLNSALAAGGSASFTCGAPTVVTITVRKTVIHNGTLDGGNNLILSGKGLTGVFSVSAGVQLSLLNLTLRDGKANVGGAIYNNGTLNVSHAAFISNTASGGSVLYNAPGAVAHLSDTSVMSNTGGGALWNGDTSSAVLSVANSRFSHNHANFGAAIVNENGPVTVTASSFTGNTGGVGGAIFNNALLWVDGSQFVANQAGVFIADSAPSGPAAPQGVPSGGGAIYMTTVGDAIIHTSSFTHNVGVSAGGAIFFGLLPPTKVINDGHQLTIDGSLFDANCTAGLGGAVAASKPTLVSNSIFQGNLADLSSTPCHFTQTDAPDGPAAPMAPQISSPNGAAGAILSSFSLSVTSSSFFSNTATITTSEGGGALYNYAGGSLSVASSVFNDNVSGASGGAIMNDATTLASIVGSDFNHNRATGYDGGAIASFGALTVDYSHFTANSQTHDTNSGGGAISSQSPLSSAAAGPNGLGPANFLTVDHSTFTANISQNRGGALYAGPAQVSHSSFLSNTAPDGGAINMLGTFTVTADTFYANAAVTTTYQNATQGGAVDAYTNLVLIENSTFFRNRAEGAAVGGAVHAGFQPIAAGSDAASGTLGSATIRYSTFVSNTADTNGSAGAIYQQNAGDVEATNTLLAYNTGGDCNLNVIFSGANLEYGDASCGAATLTSNPLALPLADNGGPTPTSALRSGSPAINAGDDLGCPAADQRGAHRPTGAHCDIGAFEFGGIVARLWLPLMVR